MHSRVRSSVRFLGGSEVRSSVSEDEPRFRRFKVWFYKGSGCLRFSISRFSSMQNGKIYTFFGILCSKVSKLGLVFWEVRGSKFGFR